MLTRSPRPSHRRLPVRKLASIRRDRNVLSPRTDVAAVLRIQTGMRLPATPRIWAILR